MKILLKIVINNRLLPVIILVNDCKKNCRLRYCSENCGFFMWDLAKLFFRLAPFFIYNFVYGLVKKSILLIASAVHYLLKHYVGKAVNVKIKL